MDFRTAREQLFAASLERFVGLRTELANELARERLKEDSRALKGIHRPSLSAWATNQVVRQALGDATAFFEASDQLRQAQNAMLTGQIERASYQALTEIFRQATLTLGTAIKRVVIGNGRNADLALVERVLSNFRNAALSEDRRADILGGQLVADIAAGDDDLANVLGAMPGGTPALAKETIPKQRLEQTRRDRDDLLRARKEELLQRLQAARDEEAAVAQRVALSRTRVTEARSAYDRAREHLDKADLAAAQARQAWRDTETTLRRAERDAAEANNALQGVTQTREAAERKAGSTGDDNRD